MFVNIRAIAEIATAFTTIASLVVSLFAAAKAHRNGKRISKIEDACTFPRCTGANKPRSSEQDR